MVSDSIQTWQAKGWGDFHCLIVIIIDSMFEIINAWREQTENIKLFFTNEVIIIIVSFLSLNHDEGMVGVFIMEEYACSYMWMFV